MISVTIPAYNAEPFIKKVLDSILTQTRLPDEIIVVNDGSTDRTGEILDMYPKKTKHKSIKKIKYKVIHQKNKGLAGASNRGIKAAKGNIIVSVDSDAILDKKFIEEATKELASRKDIGVVGGYIRTANPYSFWARIMGYDLEYRYDHICRGSRKAVVEHVSPNNTAYKREVFKRAGLYDKKFHYCQDVEHSYRILGAGYKIVLLKNVGCKHYWRETFAGYTKQQYNVSYGRMQLISANPGNARGDKVAGLRMFMQIPVTGIIILLYAGALLYTPMWWIPTALLVLLLAERSEEAIYLLKKKKSASMILMPFVHIWRNIIWGIAAVSYMAKSVGRKVRRK